MHAENTWEAYTKFFQTARKRLRVQIVLVTHPIGFHCLYISHLANKMMT